ncbi:uncharacterized protein map3k19 [Vanacampus margaritifer]
METPMDTMQGCQDAVITSRATLPSLGKNYRRRSHLFPVPSPGRLAQRSNHLPEPPTHRQRTRSVLNASPSSFGLLSLAEPNKLSQSAPSILEPRLRADYVLQARAHIQTRLGSHEAISQLKGPTLALQPASPLRTPKQLAPLDLRLRDNSTAIVLKHSVPLKPISKSPISRTHIGRRFSWGTPRTRSLPTRGGSEDSGSSTSSRSSTDLEDEDCEREDVHLMFAEAEHPEDSEFFNGKMEPSLKAPSQSGFISASHKSTSTDLQRTEPVSCQTLRNCNHATQDYSLTPSGDTVKHKTAISTKCSNNGCTTTDKQANTTIKGYLANDPATAKDSKIDEVVSCKTEGGKLNHVSAFLQSPLKCPINNQCTGLKPAKSKKALKPAQSAAKESSPNCELRTNLGHKDIHVFTPNKTPKKLSPSNQSRDNTGRSPEQIVTEQVRESLVNSKSVKVSRTSNNSLPRKRGTVSAHSRKANPDKLCTNQTPKCPTAREPKSARQLNGPDVARIRRSKSAVDFITYQDMFTTIQSESEGPAIYEMFAGPVYDNLRNPAGADDKHLRSALSRKSQEKRTVKSRPWKRVQTRIRRSPTGTAPVATKGKAKLAFSRTKARLTHATKPAHKRNSSKPETTVVFVNDGVICNNTREKIDDPTSSSIEEDISVLKPETLKTDEKSARFTCRTMEERTLNSADIRNLPVLRNQMTPESSKNNQMPTNETEKSCHSSELPVTSPVYQKFVNGVGEGPLTDDLLQCLAEELISLDEKDITTSPRAPNLDLENKNGDNRILESNAYSGVMLTDLTALHGSGLGDAISWTKGEVLGRGAYGTVSCGLTNQGQLIAVKQVTLDTSDPETARREYSRLQGEVELLKTLSHANIVGFLGTSLYQHMVSIFMEYIPGGSIASVLHRFGPLPERVLALYTCQILEGVAYLHQNRVIHRDLKGNNVMLMPTGVIKLIDFGCARRISRVSHASSGDLLKSVHGTPYWMAPEVITETGYGRKSDIWSVGCTVFEMATGKPPLAHMSKIAALFYIGAKRGLMPSLPEGFSNGAKDFVNICLTSDQRLRPSADQLLQHSFLPRNKTPFAKRNHFCGHPDGLCG